MTAYVYPAIVEGDEGSGYSIYFPDLPGCTSGGATQTEAALNAAEGLAFHIEGMLRDGEILPRASSIELAESFDPASEVGRLLVVAHTAAVRAPAA